MGPRGPRAMTMVRRGMMASVEMRAGGIVLRGGRCAYLERGLYREGDVELGRRALPAAGDTDADTDADRHMSRTDSATDMPLWWLGRRHRGSSFPLRDYC
jgi:hypothetical protein